jgi:hypothetical protein
VAPTLANIPIQDTPQTITWDLIPTTSGMPTPWNPASSPMELVGLQWQFAWTDSATPYAVDVTLDDVTLDGVMPDTDCGTYMAAGGMGGMGGMAGAAGDAGMAGSAGDGGMGGVAGAAGDAGMAGTAGGGGQGGMAGTAGAAGSGMAGSGGMAGSAGP